MKKLIYIITAILLTGNVFSQVSTCCPEFSLTQLGNIMPCQEDTTCKPSPQGTGNPGGGQFVEKIIACKNSVQTYYVFPNLPGFTFNWTITGGTPLTFSGNPAVITWGSGSQGVLQVIITDASGKCRDTITRQVCLLNSPTAAFTWTPNTPVCTNQPILFTNTSIGASTYSWNFGDGSGSTLINPPPHLYTTPGTYTVVLTVSNSSGGSNPVGDSRCGCTDTAKAIITVLAGTGPIITSPNCKKMLCPGDTATYCVSPGCAPYNWTVNGGIITANNGSCITVQWNLTPPLTLPASITVTTGCAGVCGSSATLNVPVLWNNMLITGPSPVCTGSVTTYSLPTMPGTFYTWTVTGPGGGTIVGPNINTPTISVQWNGPPGNATITCNYNNPYSGCSGSTTKTVNVRKKFVVNGPATICTGIPATYSVLGGMANWLISPGTLGTDYTVSGSMTNVPGISVTWLIAGNYTITGTPTVATAPNYCNPNAVVNVVVKPTPVLNNIVGPTSICPGSYYTYSVSSNLPGPFVWTPSANGTVISLMGTNNDMAIVQWTGTGTNTLTVTQTVNGCTGTKQLTGIVNVPAVTITGTANVCRDQAPHPAYTASGGLPAGSYTWAIVPAAAGTITGGQGSNAITVLWHGGISPGTSTANVSVVVCNYPPVLYPVTITTPPNLTVTKSGSLCTMPGVTLSVSPSLPCYQWYLDGVLLPGATSNPYIATTYGYYSVKCPTLCSGFGGIFVPREYIPNVNITANNKLGWCATETINLTLFSAAGGGCMYQWFKNGLPVGPASPTNSSLNVTTIGSYYQVVSCGNCKDTSNTIVVYIVPSNTCNMGGPSCKIHYKPLEENTGKSGPAPLENETEEIPFANTLTIGPPTNFCNNPQFSAVYNIDPGWSLNSGIHWNFGDGNTFSTTISGGFTPPHAYTAVGVYVVTAYMDLNCPPPPTPHICRFTDTIHYTVPVAAKFATSVNCEKVYLTNLSTVLTGCSITGYAWSATGPGSVTFSNPAAASPVLTVGASGTYNITLTVTSNASCNNCTATYTLPVTITLPSATFTAPSPVCAGTPISLNAPGGMSNYLWNFGDNYTSSLQNTTHAFGLTPANPTITLTVTNALGCLANFSVPINVIAPPALTITPLQLICPGTTATITATGTGFSTYGFYHNGVLVQSGPSNTYTTSVIGTYYVIGNTSTGSCVVKTVNTYVFTKPNPVADIQGSTVACMIGGSASIYLYNLVNDPTTTYVWTLQGNNTALSNVYDLNITVNATGNYSYVLTATGANGCIARDTFCVVVGNSPVVTATPSTTGPMCAGTLHTFTANATPPNPNYIYQWSNGATGPVMSTSLPGMYMVNVTDPANGCMGTAFTGVIKPRPSTILFPIGCDTLCDYDSIIPPLAMGGPIGPGSYTVQWFLNGNYGSPIYTGPVLSFLANMPPLIYGMNNISIVVTYNGCTDTSNAYNLFIDKCDSCDCKESKWGDKFISKGDKPALRTTAKGTEKVNMTAGDIKLECNKGYTLLCNQLYNINATYLCKDTACASKVTYTLQPPTGPLVSGTLGASFTPTIPGVYILTLYGWCDGKICDSCVIDIKVDCVDPCNCKGSKWNDITLIQQNNNANAAVAEGKAGNNNVIINPVKLVCGKTYDVKCKAFYSVNAGYTCVGANCPGSVQYVFTGPTGTTTGTTPLNFSLTQNGTYTLSLYGYCGTTKCDSCIIKFNVRDCPVSDSISCCPYNITVGTPTTTLSTLASPPATIVNSSFNISGPPGNLFTEIRAEVADYVLTSNFNNECINCKSYPYSWASMYQPAPIGTMQPQITMYNSTVPAFNPAGAGMYQNPREVIWNSTTPFTLPSSVNLSFLLPAISIIECCELTAKICVKFTFRDKDCKECEVIVCFTVTIKPAGSTNNGTCNCSINPLFKYEGGSKPVTCGGTITLFQGNIPVTVNPNFLCTPAGKNCQPAGLTVQLVNNTNNTTTTLTSPNYSYTFLTPGNYTYNISGTCGGKKCDCKVTMIIPQ